jgi:hypothetical protein
MGKSREPAPVIWLIAAEQGTRRAMNEKLAAAADDRLFEAECKLVGKLLRQVFPKARAIVVRDRLEGYRQRVRPHKLMVEVVQPPRQPAVGADLWSREVHLVKVVNAPKDLTEGDTAPEERTELGEELRGWERCQPPGNRDGILSSLEGVRDRRDGKLIALIYSDAYSALGGGSATSLEEAFCECCRFGTPSVESLIHLLRVLFSRLNERFYRRSFVPAREEHFAAKLPEDSSIRRGEKEGWQTSLTRQRLEKALEHYEESGASEPSPQPEEARRRNNQRQLRREALAILVAGFEKIVNDPDEPTFIDPFDYLRPVLCDSRRVPEMLVGTSHGDLHGRNILVGRLEDDVGSVAVFDYGETHPGNLIGLDFVKLEVELKVRVYPHIFDNAQTKLVSSVHAFELQLAEQTEDFYHLRPPLKVRREADPRRDRLMRLLLEIRKLAGRYLGKERYRGAAWLEEYYFLLASYAGYSSRFPTYDQLATLGAYVAAGTAGRRLGGPWRDLNAQIRRAHEDAESILQQPPTPCTEETLLCEAAKRFSGRDMFGHHARLEFYRVWAQADRTEKRVFIETAAARLDDLQKEYPHVLEITEVYLLALLELDQEKKAKEVLDVLQRKHVEFSYEIYCRFGRALRARGEAVWPQNEPPPKDAKRHFLQALVAYERAWQQYHHYYPGINVAALRLLLGEREAAAKLAETVQAVAEQQPANDHWAQVTCADALFLRDQDEEAMKRYQEVLPLCSPQNARSILRQIRRLLRVSPEEKRKSWSEHGQKQLFGENAVADVEADEARQRQRSSAPLP